MHPFMQMAVNLILVESDDADDAGKCSEFFARYPGVEKAWHNLMAELDKVPDTEVQDRLDVHHQLSH